MKSYQSHKVVQAFLINKIVRAHATSELHGEDDYVEVLPEYMDKHQPERGGYYVLYEDGYESWSPAPAFEAGYTEEKTPIKGYRNLSQDELDIINSIKTLGTEIECMVGVLRNAPEMDQRWVAIGTTDLQKGMMALVRSVAKPEGF